MVYLSNAISLGMLTEDTAAIGVVAISDNQAKSLLRDGFQSAIGHQSTADFIKALIGLEVPVNRASVSLKDGDMLVVLQFQGRLPEGKILSEEEIKQIPYKWYLVINKYLDKGGV